MRLALDLQPEDSLSLRLSPERVSTLDLGTPTAELRLQLLALVTGDASTGPTAPAAFTVGMWRLVPIVGGLRFYVDALPSDGGSPITALQYSLDGGATWHSFVGTGTGPRDVSAPPSLQTAQLRAVNAVGASDNKTATPIAAALSVTAVTINELYGAAITPAIPAVTAGHSLIIATRNTDAGTNVTGATEVSVGATYGGHYVRFFKIQNVVDGRTSVQINTPVGAISSAFAIFEVDASAVATASALSQGTGTGIAINQPFTTTADNAAAFAMARFSNGVTQTPTGGWTVAPGTPAYDAANYIADLGAAGPKATGMALGGARDWGLVVQAFVRA